MDELHERRRQQALGEIAPPVPVRRLAQIDAREVQQIEGNEGHGRDLIGRDNIALHLQLGAFLQCRERRLSARVERHDLSVENHAALGLLAELRAETWKRDGKIEPSPRAQLHPVPVDEGEHPVAIELRLPHPVCAIDGHVARFGVHWLEFRRHRFDFARRHELRS